MNPRRILIVLRPSGSTRERCKYHVPVKFA